MARRRRIDLGDALPPYTLYAVGDVHGCLDELLAVETRIRDDIVSNETPGLIVYLGDYVDRGPQSAGVLNLLSGPNNDKRMRRLPLCGNHDAIFAAFVRDPANHMEWIDHGGRQTMLSYGIDIDELFTRVRRRPEEVARVLQQAVPSRHLSLIDVLPISLRVGPFLFVHAGIRPGVTLQDQTDEDMLWIREPFLSTGPQLPFTVVHGHSPFSEPDFGRSRIGLDTGAYVSGKLSVLKIANGVPSLLDP
ncbi:metallophosphoesterase family protein [Rhizobium daejeonense]|nr:metallophosphoesterase family protein [Rhizobium daejeonense]